MSSRSMRARRRHRRRGASAPIADETHAAAADRVCDYCGSARLEWRKCKLICLDCRQINKSCADLLMNGLQLHRARSTGTRAGARGGGALHHEYVGTEHMLLGVVREGEGVAATVLENLGVDLDGCATRSTRQ